MANEKKKLAAGPIFGILAAILGVVGIAVTVYCSRMNSAYSLSSLNETLLFSAVAAVLSCLSAIFGKAKGNYNVLSTICQICAIVLFVFAIGNILMERVLLASGLFSYNSQNQAGWQVFYASVTAIGFYLAADLFLILSSFMKSVKD